MESIKGKAAIIGIGEVPTGRYPDRNTLSAALEVSKQAIESAGIRNSDIDLVMPTVALGNRVFNSALSWDIMVEELSLPSKGSRNFQVMAGGASSYAMLQTAVSMVCAGTAKMILCLHADSWGFSTQEIINSLAVFSMSEEWEVPYGPTLANCVGMIQQRYMHETGTTPEQCASVCVALRKWAQLNPNAMYRDPLTVEEVLDSGIIVTPLHRKELCSFVDAGSAFIVTTAERARTLCPAPVYVLGFGSATTHYCIAQDPDLTRLGYPDAAQEAYRMAGISAKDIDIAELYDALPAIPLIALEGLGICERGEAGSFVAEGHTSPGGDLPMTTNGGMLSQGHGAAGGGVAVLVEACRQLMGKADQRQVPDAKIAAVTSTGGTYNDAHISILGREIP